MQDVRLTSSVCTLNGSSSARAASLSTAGWLRRLRAVGDHVRRGQEWPDAGAAGTRGGTARFPSSCRPGRPLWLAGGCWGAASAPHR